MRTRSPGGGVPSRADHLWGGIFLLVWLLPLLWAGTVRAPVPFYPNYLNLLYSVSDYFNDSVASWDVLYLQARRRGEREWIDLPREEYFRAKPFGHLLRLDMLLLKEAPFFFPPSPGDPFSGPRFELSRWLAIRTQRLQPDRAPVAAIRYVRVRHRVGRDLEAPAGRWSNPPLSEIPAARRRVIATDDLLQRARQARGRR